MFKFQYFYALYFLGLTWSLSSYLLEHTNYWYSAIHNPILGRIRISYEQKYNITSIPPWLTIVCSSSLLLDRAGRYSGRQWSCSSVAWPTRFSGLMRVTMAVQPPTMFESSRCECAQKSTTHVTPLYTWIIKELISFKRDQLSENSAWSSDRTQMTVHLYIYR